VQTKRERIILYGIVPVAATIIGSLATVILQRIFGSSESGGAIVAVIKTAGLTPPQKVELIKLVNANDDRFYSFLSNTLILLSIPVGSIFYALADWIKRR
jgi:hypothetical protein